MKLHPGLLLPLIVLVGLLLAWNAGYLDSVLDQDGPDRPPASECEKPLNERPRACFR